VDFLKDLNEAQRAAATDVDGPCMIIAGAGSGKTRVLTYRIAFILDQGMADPFQILALTFTNKAAREMKERIEKLIGPAAKNLWMGTFHSVFARMLRKEAEKIGFTNSFTIYDSDDSLTLIRKIVREMNLDDKKFKPKTVQNYISGAKNSLVDPDEYAANYVNDSFTNSIAVIYKKYNTRLFDSNAMDFDDLLVKPLDLFDRHPEALYRYQNKFSFVLIDEFQDTNLAQNKIAHLLSAKHQNLCVVGDDAQSIYSFRGATIDNILNFRKNYDGAKMFKLEQNYRSTGNIVSAANSIIAKNKNQIPKLIYTENQAGELIRLLEAATEQEESRMTVDLIREQKMVNHFSNRDFAILYRTNAQSRVAETELRRAGIHYRVFGGLSFYQRKEIKDVLAYMKLAINPKDESAILRIINYPVRGIGQTSIDKMSVLANENSISLWDLMLRLPEFKLGRRLEIAIDEFTTQIKSYGQKAQQMNAWEIASHIGQHTGILKELHQENSIESISRWENVQELLNAAREFTEDPENDAHSLDAFLAEISLLTDQDLKTNPDGSQEKDYVTLMTMHASKGLEFPSVFVVGLEEELFPSFLSLQSREDLEEERRLFYVATTRAMQKLTLSYAKSRYKYGNLQYNEPSRFLADIDPAHLSTPVKSKKENYPSGANWVRPTRKDSIAGGSLSFSADDLTSLVTGMQVIHQKFGEGKVLSTEGSGQDRKAVVYFSNKGQKVLLLKYAKLKIMKES